MSQNETIDFACPNCNTSLKVPAHLAGITGPCPHCGASITAPHPVASPPQQAPPQQAPPQQAPPQQQVYAQQAPPTQSTQSSQSGSLPSERPQGTPPHNQQVSNSSQPTPSRAAQSDRAQTQAPSVKRRKIWPTILFPALFLLLAAAVVYLILYQLGILDFKKKKKK